MDRKNEKKKSFVCDQTVFGLFLEVDLNIFYIKKKETFPDFHYVYRWKPILSIWIGNIVDRLFKFTALVMHYYSSRVANDNAERTSYQAAATCSRYIKCVYI